MKIIVIGGGAWGTALALSASRNAGDGAEVTLWVRDAQQAEAMAQQGENKRYLPGFPFAPGLRVSSNPLSQVLAPPYRFDLAIIASPMAGLRGLLTQLQDCAVPVAWLCKGFEASQDGGPGLLGHEVLSQVAPALRAGVLSGPSFAQEVAQGLPTALVAASNDAALREALVAAFHSPALRVYANDDVVGVEVGGAVKNVMAIATGLCDGLRLGLNARAALITRGLAEMTRLGLALGARAETFMGLSGLGDLVLTATGDLSRNRRVGLALGQGKSMEAILADMRMVAEGVKTTKVAHLLAARLGVSAPITDVMHAIIHLGAPAGDTMRKLMARSLRSERD